MRVLFWQEGFWPIIGGVELLGAKLLLALRERGHELAVVTRQEPPELPCEDRWNGIPVYRFPFWSTLARGDVDSVFALRREVAALKRRFAPDVVHVNSLGPTAFYQLETMREHPAPLLLTLHSHNLLPGPASLARRTLLTADWVACCSASILEHALGVAPEIAPHASVVYNGREAPALLPGPLPLRPPRLLYLGRLIADKCVDVAIDACASVRERFPDLRLTIAGDGPERAALERRALERGMRDATDFTGLIHPAKVPELINTAALVLLPSRRESFSLVALEAALMCRPVIASRIGGLPEVVSHRETGWLVEANGSTALAEAISFALDHPEMVERMGRAARDRTLRLFSLERHVDANEALYHQLVENRRGRTGRARGAGAR